jgi:hypothetical protein
MPASTSASTNTMSDFTKGHFRVPGCTARIHVRCLSLTAHAAKVHGSANEPLSSFAMLTCRSISLGCLGENGFGTCLPGPKTCPKACPREAPKFLFWTLLFPKLLYSDQMSAKMSGKKPWSQWRLALCDNFSLTSYSAILYPSPQLRKPRGNRCQSSGISS